MHKRRRLYYILLRNDKVLQRATAGRKAGAYPYDSKRAGDQRKTTDINIAKNCRLPGARWGAWGPARLFSS